MKVGILGFAHGHVNTYCNVWRERPDLGIEPTIGWDHDAGRAAGAAKRGIAITTTPEDLLADETDEGVVIAAETSMHADLVVKAADAGKQIVLQKPMAITMEDADRIVAAVETTGVPFTMAWQMRVDRQNLQMRDWIRCGALGKIYMVRRRHGLPTQSMQDFHDSWHVDPALNRDIWADDAAHPIDFIYWLFGMPASVTAEISTVRDERIPNDGGIAILRYEEGMIAEVSCSFVAIAEEPTTEIIAEKGVVIQNYGDLPSSSVPRPAGGIELKRFMAERGEWEESDLPGYPSQGARIANLAEPIAAFLRGEGDCVATAEEGRDALRMVQACYESTEQGRRVVLSRR